MSREDGARIGREADRQYTFESAALLFRENAVADILDAVVFEVQRIETIVPPIDPDKAGYQRLVRLLRTAAKLSKDLTPFDPDL